MALRSPPFGGFAVIGTTPALHSLLGHSNTPKGGLGFEHFERRMVYHQLVFVIQRADCAARQPANRTGRCGASVGLSVYAGGASPASPDPSGLHARRPFHCNALRGYENALERSIEFLLSHEYAPGFTALCVPDQKPHLTFTDLPSLAGRGSHGR